MKTLEGHQIGKRGDVVGSRNRYGPHVRQAGHPKRRRTAAKNCAEGAMSAVSAGWEELSDGQRAAWAWAGAKVPSRRVLGESWRLDGRGFFAKVNLPRARLGQELLTEPPARVVFERNPVTAFTIARGRKGMTLTLMLDRRPVEELLVYGSPPCNQGKRRCWDLRVLGLLANAAKGPNEITKLYAAKYGLPRAGKRLFIRVRQQMMGWRGDAWEGNMVVPGEGGMRMKGGGDLRWRPNHGVASAFLVDNEKELTNAPTLVGRRAYFRDAVEGVLT